MASQTKEEFPPLLPVGFHPFDVAGLRRLCLSRFPGSLTRQRIMSGLEEVLSLLQQNQIHGEVWINGSFTTEKLNPDDSDIVLVVDASVARAFSPQQRAFYTRFANSDFKPQYCCDNYAMIRDTSDPRNDWVIAYWLRQFGFSRANEMKGLAVVQLPFLVRP